MKEFIKLLQVLILVTLVFFGIFFICSFIWFAAGMPENMYAMIVLVLITIGLSYSFYLWVVSTFKNKK